MDRNEEFLHLKKLFKTRIENLGLPWLGQEEAEDYSAILTAGIANEARILGKNILEYADSLNFRYILDPPQRTLQTELLYQSVFHGSPQRGIKKMSLQNIGTGEGAQAYGWGIYAAEARETGESYRKKLTKDWLYDGERQLSGYDEWAAGNLLLDMKRRGVIQEEAMADMRARHSGSNHVARDDFIKALDGFTGKLRRKKPRGQLYRLEIPESDELLDWDKPLSEQSEKVRAALEKEYGGDITGADLYISLSRQLDSQQFASEYLNSLGIPGLQYLDGNSRSGRQGTHNFVVWDENRMSVEETFYQHGMEKAADTESKTFQKWFGKSKVVDSDGNPLEVYTGGPKDITAFDPEMTGSNTQTLGTKGVFYFTDNYGLAKNFADYALPAEVLKLRQAYLTAERDAKNYKTETNRKIEEKYQKALQAESRFPTGRVTNAGEVYPVYLSIQNPYVFDMEGKLYSPGTNKVMISNALKNGYDGVIIQNVIDGINKKINSNEYIVFNPEQIKSVHNRGTWNAIDPNIYFQDKKVENLLIKEKQMWAETLLLKDERTWADEVDKYTNNPKGWNKSRPVQVLSQTPLVFHLIGAQDHPITMNARHFGRNIDSEWKQKLPKEERERMHVLPPELVKQIPRAMADPVMILKDTSRRQSEAKNTTFIVMLELRHEGKSIVVPFTLNKTQGKDKNHYNIIDSFYDKDGREINRTGESYEEWFIKQIKNGNALYINREKIRTWGQLADKETKSHPEARSASITVKADKSPSYSHVTKLDAVLQDDSLMSSIPNEIDLDKLKNKNKEHYQTSGSCIPRASTRFLNGQSVITLFKDADRSSFLHEMGHFFLESRRRLSLIEDVPQQVKDDWNAIKKWLDVEDIDFSKALAPRDSDRWHTAQEKWAAGFERYLMEGKAPSPELAHAFEDFKEWLTDIYQTVKNILHIDANGKSHPSEINDEIREVMGRILGREQEQSQEQSQEQTRKAQLNNSSAVDAPIELEAGKSVSIHLKTKPLTGKVIENGEAELVIQAGGTSLTIRRDKLNCSITPLLESRTSPNSNRCRSSQHQEKEITANRSQDALEL